MPDFPSQTTADFLARRANANEVFVGGSEELGGLPVDCGAQAGENFGGVEMWFGLVCSVVQTGERF